MNDYINFLRKKRNKLSAFRKIPVNNQGFVLLSLSKYLQKKLLSKLKIKEILSFLEYLDPDETTDILQRMNKIKRHLILKSLKNELRKKVTFLLKFNSKTAAGIMNLDYIEVDYKTKISEIYNLIKKHESRTGKFPTIIVVQNGFLKGEFLPQDLIIANKKQPVINYAKHVPSIKYDADSKKVIALFKHHPHNKIIVLDEDDSIMGVIYSDDILKLIQKHSSDSLSNFAGITEEDVFDSAFDKVKHRYKWLIINLATSFLAASVVSLFEKTISAFVLLAVYMPIVAGMGGNAGTQTLAVMIRGLTLGEISLKNYKRALFNEIIAGFINGLINGLLVAVVASIWNKNALFGLVVALAMVINLVIAGIFGVLIPLFMKLLNKDPATSATIFITTATDVFGFFCFLGLASIIL